MHYKAQETLFFYFIASIFVLVLVLGFIGVVHLWLLGRAKRENAEVNVSKFIISLLKAGIFQTQLLEYSIFSWIEHLFISLSFLALLLLTAFHFILMWIVPSSSGFFEYFKSDNGNLILAFWGDFWGLLFIVGLLLAICRRYLLKPQQLNTIADDSIAIFSLLVIAVSGFLCEALRLAARPETTESAYSFVVNWAVPFLRAQQPGEAVVGFFFWMHALFSFLFLAYVPFGKFRHIFASPLVYALVTSNSLYTKEGRICRTSRHELHETAGGAAGA